VNWSLKQRTENALNGKVFSHATAAKKLWHESRLFAQDFSEAVGDFHSRRDFRVGAARAAIAYLFSSGASRDESASRSARSRGGSHLHSACRSRSTVPTREVGPASPSLRESPFPISATPLTVCSDIAFLRQARPAQAPPRSSTRTGPGTAARKIHPPARPLRQ